MEKNKIIKIQSIILSLILILNIVIPIFVTAEENQIAKITVSREKVGNTNILTIKDIVAKITDVRIVYGERITEPSYFLDEDRNLIEGKGEDLLFETITETEELHEIKASFDIRENCYEYTVFIFDQNRNSFTYNYSITPNTITINSVTASENNKKELTINVSDTASNISLIKIAKVQSEDEQVDFGTQGIIVGENYNIKEVIVNYTVQEDGIYKIYAENEQKQGFIWTTRVYSENPITIDWKQDETEKNKLIFNIQDKLFDITSVKVAKYSINTEIDWENATALYPSEQEVNLENLSCYVSEEGKYSIRVEDSQGFSYVKTTSRIYFSDENTPVINLYIDKNTPNIVKIEATDNMFEISEMKVAIGEEFFEPEEMKTSGNEIEIIKGNVVNATYQIQEENKIICVFCVAEDGQAFMFQTNIGAIEIVGEEEPEQEEPEQEEPEQEEPEQDEPEQEEPEQEEPEQDEPEQDEPEQDEPEQDEPEQEEPEQEEPEQEEPEQEEPEQDEQEEPEQDEQEQDEPEQDEPEQDEPEQDEPEQGESEQEEPEQEESEQDEPEQNESEQKQEELEQDDEEGKTENEKVNANKTEVKDNTTSNKPLPQTGIQAGILIVIFALAINSIAMLRKIIKCR